MTTWAVVMTKPNSEAIAVTNLKRQGYECYFPRFLDPSPKKCAQVKPLFPRYIFVAINGRWYSIRGTRGVSHLLLGDDGPAIINNSIIESIKSREDQSGLVKLSDNNVLERFSKGEKIKAMDGPLTGLDMIYQGMAGPERVKVLVELLGRKVTVSIEEKLLSVA